MVRYDAYIDSQTPYIGDIPSHWKMVQNKRVMHKEKRICDTYSGQNIISLTLNGAIVRDLGAGGKMPATFDGYQYVYPGELLMCLFDIDVTPRCVGRVNNEGLTSPAYSSFVLHDNADLGYYYYYYLMLDHSKELLHLAKNLRHSLTEEQIGQIKVPLPPILEQQAIAEYLDKKIAHIDAIIAEAKASIEEYKSWKASIIYEAVTKGLDPNVEMKDSGVEWIGKMPSNWNVCKALYALSMPITDGPHTTPELYDDGVPFISAEAVSCGKKGRIAFDHMRGYISEKFYQECSQKYIPQINDIYMIKSGATTGRVAFVDTDIKFTIWSPLAVFRSNPDRMYFKYLFYFLQSDAYQKQVELGWTYGTQQNIGMRTLEKLKVCMPPLSEQKAIADILDQKCDNIDTLIEEKESLVADLELYKKSLIFEVVTGKRKVV